MLGYKVHKLIAVELYGHVTGNSCALGSALPLSLTFPALSAAPAYEDDPAYSKRPELPQTHAGSAGGSPVKTTVQQLLPFYFNYDYSAHINTKL